METDAPPPFFISLSQEEKLRTLRYQGLVVSDSSSSAADNPLDISVSSTPIFMESLPESPHQEGGSKGAAADGHFKMLPKDFDSANDTHTGEGCNHCSETVATLPPEFVEGMEILKESAPTGEESATNVHRDIVTTYSYLGLPPEASKRMKILEGFVAKSVVNAPSLTREENTCFASTSSTDLGEAVTTGETAENVVKAVGASDGRKAGGIKRSLKQDLLAILTGTLRVTGQHHQCLRKSGSQQVGILEVAKRSGMKFPKPDHWPPGKEL